MIVIPDTVNSAQVTAVYVCFDCTLGLERQIDLAVRFGALSPSLLVSLYGPRPPIDGAPICDGVFLPLS